MLTGYLDTLGLVNLSRRMNYQILPWGNQLQRLGVWDSMLQKSFRRYVISCYRHLNDLETPRLEMLSARNVAL